MREAHTEAEAAELLRVGTVQFVINIPEDFSRRLLRGERPTVLVEADATDPAATGPAIAAAREYLAEHACFTRLGNGGVAQVDANGLIAAAFTHRD